MDSPLQEGEASTAGGPFIVSSWLSTFGTVEDALRTWIGFVDLCRRHTAAYIGGYGLFWCRMAGFLLLNFAELADVFSN